MDVGTILQSMLNECVFPTHGWMELLCNCSSQNVHYGELSACRKVLVFLGEVMSVCTYDVLHCVNSVHTCVIMFVCRHD